MPTEVLRGVRKVEGGSRTLPVTSAVGYERWLSRPNGSLRLRSSGGFRVCVSAELRAFPASLLTEHSASVAPSPQWPKQLLRRRGASPVKPRRYWASSNARCSCTSRVAGPRATAPAAAGGSTARASSRTPTTATPRWRPPRRRPRRIAARQRCASEGRPWHLPEEPRRPVGDHRREGAPPQEGRPDGVASRSGSDPATDNPPADSHPSTRTHLRV